MPEGPPEGSQLIKTYMDGEEVITFDISDFDLSFQEEMSDRSDYGRGPEEEQLTEVKEVPEVPEVTEGVTDNDVAIIDAMASSVPQGIPGKKDWKEKFAETLKGMRSHEQLREYVVSAKNKNTTRKTNQVRKK